ncbi:DUF2299 family protein, partial [bacterium]|nr:DUF2299 family protein [bacterium]
LKGEASPPKAAWAFEAQYPGQPFVALVLQPTDKPDLVLVVANQEIAKGLTDRLAAMPDDEYQRFELDLRLDLNRRPPEVGIVQGPKRRLWRLQHACPVFADGLNKDSFMRALRHVFRNLMHVDLWLARNVPGPGKPMAFRLRPKESWVDLEDAES